MQVLLLLFSVLSCVICHVAHQAVPYRGYGFRSHHHHHHQIRSLDSSTLTLHYKSNFIGVVNETARHAVIFEYSSTIFAVHQASVSSAINSQTRTIANTSSWSSRQNFEAFFKSVTQIDATNARNLTSSDEIHADFLGLERFNCLETLIGISKTFNRLRGVLGLVLRREGKIPVRGLVRFVNLVQTLESLGVLRRIRNFQQVLNSQNGLEGLRRVLEGMRHQNISRVLGPTLNNMPSLLALISKLGQSSNPMDAVFRIVSTVLTGQNGHGGFLEVVIHEAALLYHLASNTTNNQDNSNSSIAGIEKLLQNQTSQSPNSNGLSNFLHFLQALRSRSMNIQGIPLSQIIEFIRGRSAKGPMDFMVHMLTFLRNQIRPGFSISRLFEFIAAASNSSGPGSSPITGIAHELQGQNMTEICRRVSESLNRASNGTLNLESILGNQNASKVGSEVLASILRQNHTALESIIGQNNPILGSIQGQNDSSNGIAGLLGPNLQNSQNTELPNIGSLLGSLETTTKTALNRKRRNHQDHHHHAE